MHAESSGDVDETHALPAGGCADLPRLLRRADADDGVRAHVRPSGDVRADMDLVRAFYADKQGIRPENRTEPRLREEDAAPDAG